MTRRSRIGVIAAASSAAVWAAARAMRQRRRVSFRDAVVVITGGSRGLGLVIARELAGEGARLALLARQTGTRLSDRATARNNELPESA